MKAKEMFKQLGYKTDCIWQKDHTIEYVKYEEDDFYDKRLSVSIIFHKRAKIVKVVGVLAVNDLQAINKQIEELGWN